MIKDNKSYHGWHSPEPIGLEYICATLSEAGFDCFFESQNELRVKSVGIDRCISFISGMTWEWRRILELIENAKSQNLKVVLGGYHACGNWRDISKECCNHIIVGEGEEVAVMLAKVLLKGETVEFCGQVYSLNNLPRIIPAPRIKDINSLPYPARSEERLGTYILFDLMWPPSSMQNNTSIILTSRGCKHNCDFCASFTIWGQGVRFRTSENIIAELEELKDRFSMNTVIIIDQSFGQAKKWTLEVCQAIKEADLGINWYHQSNLDVDRDVIQAMADAGCTKIGFGLEGISPTAIEKIKPINPHNMEKINDLFDFCRSLGMFVKTYLMIGYPWEDQAIIEEYKYWVTTIRASQIKISYMTPFPGTRYWDTYSDRLLTRDWSRFDTVSMPVVHNRSISVDEYNKIRQELFRSFYGSSIYARTTKAMLEKYPHYAQSFREFCLYLKPNNMITGRESWLELIGYCDEWSSVAKEVLACKS